MRIPVGNGILTIKSDLCIAGVYEDGESYVGEYFYLQLETLSGKRYDHTVRFNTVLRTILDEGHSFTDVRKSAERQVEFLLDRVKKRGYIDDLFWEEVEARYGSPRYYSQQRGECDV